MPSKHGRELAIRGAAAVLADVERRDEAIADIIRWSTDPESAPWDWDALARVEELAWGHAPEEE